MRACTRTAALLWATLATSLIAAAAAQPAPAQQLTPFGGQTYTQPFYVAGDPSDASRVFVVEAPGTIRLVENGVTQSAPFLDASADVWDINEGGCECGMFSMALPPDYATSGRFYVFYTRDVPGAGIFHDLVIREYQRSASNPDVADPSTARDVLVIQHRTAGNHNGGQLQFGPDGLLYVSVGDGGNTPDQARSLTSLLGKILRIDPEGTSPLDYSIPADNPFADGAGGNADEIYAYGLRNPYRFSFDRLTGALTIGDVGQSAWEEVDFTALGQGRGANFGWNCFEGSGLYSGRPAACNPPPANHVPPVLEYANPAVGGAAITGGYVVRDLTVPSLVGRYVYTDSSGALGNTIYAATLSSGGASGNGPTGLTTSGGVVSFGEDACGHVYVAAIGGAVSRIEPSGGSPACVPQTALSTASARDQDPPDLSVDTRQARRAGQRGELTIGIGCDEACTVTGAGEIRVPGKDLGADPDSTGVAAGGTDKLRLDLSGRQARRLLALLRRGRAARAAIGLAATDAAGNTSRTERQVKQRD